MATGGWLLLLLLMMMMMMTSVMSSRFRPRDCKDLLDSANPKFLQHSEFFENGVQTIYVGREQRAVKVYCDMQGGGGIFSEEGGWTVCVKTFL